MDDLYTKKKHRAKYTLTCSCGAVVKRDKKPTRGEVSCNSCKAWRIRQRANDRKKALKV